MSNPDYYDGSLLKGAPKAKRKRAPGTTLPASSQQQDKRQGFLLGIKAERLRQQALRPHKMLPLYGCEGDCGTFFNHFEEAFDKLDGHHVEARDRGQGFRNGSFGVDHPDNIVLLCRTCHQQTEPQPEWTT